MKLHLGCGGKYIPGWVHVDAVAFQHVQIRNEIDNLPMIGTETVSIIYACHVFEHYLRKDAHRVLLEWHRVLEPGGILRLAVPDFSAIAHEYVDRGQLNEVIGLLFGRQDFLYNFHYMVYDEESLKTLLLSCGFVNPHRYDWTKTEHANIDDFSQAYLPHMDKTNGRLMSLNMEATKP